MPKVTLGLIIPRAKPGAGQNRRPNASLTKTANWTRGHILNEECQTPLLKDIIPTMKKPIPKPSY